MAYEIAEAPAGTEQPYLGLFHEPAAPVAAAFPTITNVVFRTSGNSSANNCCRLCPTTLGVGRGGTASNGMELIYTVSGHRRGINYDILRTRRNTLFQRRAGAWARLETQPMGTFDDRHNDDECLTLRDGKLYVIDTPGYPGTVLPRANGARFGGLTAGVRTDADATEVLIRFNFAEWVIAKDFLDPAGKWTPISSPMFFRWHSITWLRRNGANQWVLDPRSTIGRGNLAETVIGRAPV